jgi:hypothetical protein
MALTMAREDVDAASPHIAGELDIMRLVTHNVRPVQTETVMGCCLEQEMCVGLDAPATIRSPVRTDIDVRDRHAPFAKAGNDVIVHPRHVPKRDRTFSDARLVGDDEEQEIPLETP